MPTLRKAPSPSVFRSQPVRAAATRVDRENRVIYGAKIIQLGKIDDGEGRRNIIDQTTLDQVVNLGTAAGPRGIKSRFTHPSMSSDGLGKFLGRYKSFRLEGDAVLADLHLGRAAFTSPKGNLGQWVLDMAEEDPEAFGNSIVFTPNRDAMKKTRIEDGPDEGWEYTRLKKLRAADVVDDPAATRGGFFSTDESLFPSLAELPAAATQLLDHYFAEAPPEAVRARVDGLLRKYFSAKGFPMPKDGLKENDTKPADTKADETKLADTKSAETKLDTTPADRAAIERAAFATENARVKEITAACFAAGFPDMVDRLTALDPKFSLAEAKSELLDATVKRGGRPAGDDGGKRDSEDKADPNKAFKAEYAAQAKLHAENGISEEDYCRSRRIDAGLEGLAPAPKK